MAVRVLLLVAGFLPVGAVPSAAEVAATLIDRQGTRFELTKFRVRGQSSLTYYLEGARQEVPLREIDRFRFAGGPGEEEQELVVHMRSGEVERGTFVIATTTPSVEALGGGMPPESASGSTRLGPFTILLRDVAEVVLRHPDAGRPVAPKPPIRGSLVNEKGRRFEVQNLRYRGKREFAFQQGRRQRSLDMSKIKRIEFTEAGVETRPIVITLRSGKTIYATVDASTVRLSGERDYHYHTRVDSAFTGYAGSSRFAIGVQDGAPPPASRQGGGGFGSGCRRRGAGSLRALSSRGTGPGAGPVQNRV